MSRTSFGFQLEVLNCFKDNLHRIIRGYFGSEDEYFTKYGITHPEYNNRLKNIDLDHFVFLVSNIQKIDSSFKPSDFFIGVACITPHSYTFHEFSSPLNYPSVIGSMLQPTLTQFNLSAGSLADLMVSTGIILGSDSNTLDVKNCLTYNPNIKVHEERSFMCCKVIPALAFYAMIQSLGLDFDEVLNILIAGLDNFINLTE